MSESRNNLSASPQTDNASMAIEVLILQDFFSIEKMQGGLSEAKLEINWQQAATKAEYSDRLTPQLDIILWDAHQTKITLAEAISVLLKNNLNIPLLVINGEPSTSTAVAAIKAGAADYLTASEFERLPRAIAQALAEPDFLSLQSKCIDESQQQLQKLITDNADGIIVVDEQGIVQFVNPAALQLLRKSSAELVGESLGFPVVDGDYSEVDIPRIPQETLVAQMRVSQIQWQGTNAYIVSLRDITQLKQAQEERAELLKEAQAANRAKDEFLAILSHELRTPLNPIVGWSQLLSMGSLSEAQARKGVEIIQRNAMLQAQLIEDLLDISRIIQGKLKLKVEGVNLVSIINNALDTVSLAAQAKSIEIATDLDKNVSLIQGDSTRLQQAVWNLLSNAVKFTPNGGKVDVCLAAVSKEVQQPNYPDGKDRSIAYAQIQIKDSGKGIDPEFLPYVFDYFRQAQSTKSRAEGGLGLGLAIVRRLIELHGGEVTATSPGLGKGATFTILLPIVSTPNKSASTVNSIQHSENLEGIDVLIVDDDDSSRELLVLILENKGAKTLATGSPTEALAVIEQFEPDILVSDIGMPGMDGYELLEKVKQLSLTTSPMAIALSAYASESDRQKSLAAGFDVHINKPLDVNNFVQIVAQIANSA